jgi:DNA-binding transcriptional LysR family regulator
MIRDLDQAVRLARQAARNQAGQITIGFIPGTESKVFMVLLPVLWQKFQQIQPVFRTRLSASDLLAGLKDRTLNAAFLYTDEIVDQEIVSNVIFRQPLYVALPAKHRLSRLKRIPVAKLATVPLVRPDPVELSLVRVINSLAEKHRVKFTVAIDMDNVFASLNAVSSGTGFTLLPEYYRHILPDNVIMRPLDDDSPPILNMHIAYRKDNRLPALACFLELVREHLPEPA